MRRDGEAKRYLVAKALVKLSVSSSTLIDAALPAPQGHHDEVAQADLQIASNPYRPELHYIKARSQMVCEVSRPHRKSPL